MTVEVTSRVLEAMREAARAARPREACGILLGEGTRIDSVIETANVHRAPETHFEIDSKALIEAHRAAREGGLQVLGYYHSHPSGRAEPSDTDRAHAEGGGAIWAIIAGDTVRFWRDDKHGFTAISYRVAKA